MAKYVNLTDQQVREISTALNSTGFLGLQLDAVMRALDQVAVSINDKSSKAAPTRSATTGFTAMGGVAANKGALNAAAAGTASAAYVQGELQGALNRIAALEAKVRAHDAAMFATGVVSA